MNKNQETKQRIYSLALNTKYDTQLIDYLAGIPNKQAYIRQLITEDMERQGIHVEDTRKSIRNIRGLVRTRAFDQLSQDALQRILNLIENNMNNAMDEKG